MEVYETMHYKRESIHIFQVYMRFGIRYVYSFFGEARRVKQVNKVKGQLPKPQGSEGFHFSSSTPQQHLKGIKRNPFSMQLLDIVSKQTCEPKVTT